MLTTLMALATSALVLYVRWQVQRQGRQTTAALAASTHVSPGGSSLEFRLTLVTAMLLGSLAAVVSVELLEDDPRLRVRGRAPAWGRDLGWVCLAPQWAFDQHPPALTRSRLHNPEDPRMGRNRESEQHKSVVIASLTEHPDS
jgi:hypothetical protein